VALRDVTEAFQTGAKRAVPRRKPVLVSVGEVAGRLVAHLPRWRTTLLSVGGFGFVSAAAWDVARPLGLLSIGLSLLATEYLTGQGEPEE